ncbi:MAG TPA: SDR family oxidoreductase [Acidimicrobiales bacterium]|nr:SDR family oxidoreductase [Acidimicrobiales bacterium]
MDLGMAGRVAVVTGASRGIGRAVAALLAAEGAHLVVNARSPQGLDRVLSELPGAVAVAGDVVDPRTTDRLLEAAADGGGPHVVVNNAGGESGHRPLADLHDGAWERAYRLNVVSAVRLAVGAAEVMRRSRGGRIVNVASYTARAPEPFCGPYAAAKAALVNATRTLSRTYGPEGVCVNCVLPGLTSTEGTMAGLAAARTATGRPTADLVETMLRRAPNDAGRMGSAAEVAAAVVFLCSEPASWITGAALAVDGGTIRTIP